MPANVNIDGVTYTVEKRDDGNIRVMHAGGQLHPMQGPGTDGVHWFEVHPCQTRWYEHWNRMLPPQEQAPTGPGRDGEKPWWSSRSWKKVKSDE